MSRNPGHPLLAASLGILMWPFRSTRRAIVRLAYGRVLEIGVGTGLNIREYIGVSELWGVEPDPHMLRRAWTRADSVRFPVYLLGSAAESLPFPDDSFDTVVATWVLCTIQDPQQAIREILRVLRPGGTFVFAEHTRSRVGWVAWLQDKLTPLWKQVAGGCHLNRRSLSLLSDVGFSRIEASPYGRERWSLAPVYGGTARKVGDRR